jgi:N,N'-diacetyllegionaminate synthase
MRLHKSRKKKITIIAEIGENYLGNFKFAKKMISQARSAGADYAKFQSYNEDCLKQNDPEYEWFRKVSLSDDNHLKLQKFCKKKNISFLSSPFSMERAEFLCEKLGLKHIKIASCKNNDKELLKYLDKKCKKIYFSTGLINLKEIKKTLKYLQNTEVVIMHCVSEYPLVYKNANLLAIRTLLKEFSNHEIGYSDHSIGNLACLVAVCLGASVLEKHFTLNKKMKGTDHVLSADLDDLTLIRKETDNILNLMGSEKKEPTKYELKIRKFLFNRFKN